MGILGVGIVGTKKKVVGFGFYQRVESETEVIFGFNKGKVL